jgi:hypothetical protein
MPSASALSEGEKGIPKHYLTPDMSHERKLQARRSLIRLRRHVLTYRNHLNPMVRAAALNNNTIPSAERSTRPGLPIAGLLIVHTSGQPRSKIQH